jgi:hypothetical protein
MIVTTFIFTPTGEPLWYLSSGIYSHATGTFHSSYDSYSGGQCFGCAANQPVVHSAAAGQMTIQFHDNQSATLTTPNGPLEITKFNYGFPSQTGVLYGEWIFSLNVSGLIDGDWVIFDHPYTGSDGTVYAAGQTDDSLAHIALGAWEPTLGSFLVVVQSSGNYLHSYQLRLDDHRGIGSGWVLLSSETPTGNGSPVFAARALYQSEIGHLNANPAVHQSSSTRDPGVLASQDDDKTVPAAAAAIGRLSRALEEYARSR